METLIVEVTNKKAYKLLENLEELKLIRVLKKKSDRISNLRGKIKTRMSNSQVEKQLNTMRKEWQRGS
ncbi:hypothetical protein RM545_12070 [Zunongwangia sp. F260]|uniref:50S ribosomal protein L29 n=1 Tax=Autumnicola lenta TaxID=3075593 RepID=A0ABU3CMI5_9FLAO|nr:hypothetical protein [Zunongwangia sp. F260]MDT0647428.1 hypothetical protein [Zunongwangia sp. F260]